MSWELNMTKSKLIPLLPITPPILEYVDGVLTKDSVEILEQDVNWFTNYAQQYLLVLKTLYRDWETDRKSVV